MLLPEGVCNPRSHGDPRITVHQVLIRFSSKLKKRDLEDKADRAGQNCVMHGTAKRCVG